MSNKQQTAVDWLIDQVEDFLGLLPIDMIEKAKELEKQQIIDAHLDGAKNWVLDEKSDKQRANEFYKETYGE